MLLQAQSVLRQLLTEVCLDALHRDSYRICCGPVIIPFNGACYYRVDRGGGCHRTLGAFYDCFNMTHDSNQALIRDGPELWQMLVGSEEKEKNNQSDEGMAHSE